MDRDGYWNLGKEKQVRRKPLDENPSGKIPTGCLEKFLQWEKKEGAKAQVFKRSSLRGRLAHTKFLTLRSPGPSSREPGVRLLENWGGYGGGGAIGV